MSGDSTKDWAEAHWAPLTGENTELTQFNIWHHRRFGFVDHRDSACGNRWLAWEASREDLRKDADKWQIVERAMTQLQSDEQGAAIWSACSRILISVAGKLNSAHSTVTEEGVTFDGVEAGDWRVTVERIDAAMGKGERS